MKRNIVILVMIVLLPLFLSADIFPKVGTAGVQFLKLGIDARAIGMGEAYTAVSNDISSTYWNPAGLSLNPQNQVLLSHTEYVADIRHEYLAASRYFDFGTLALSISFLHMGEMDVTTVEQFGPTGEKFTCYDLAAGLSYSYQFTDKFSFGATGKFIREELDESRANGLSFDIGTLYNTGFQNVTIGMAMRNFGPDMEFDIDEDGDGEFDEDPFDLLDNDHDGLIDEDREEMPFKIPMNFSLGVSADVFRERDTYLITSVQLDSYVDREETYNLGFEYKIANFFLRSGYQFGFDAAGFNAGFGILVPTSFAVFSVDCSYTDYGDLAETAVKTPLRLSLKLLY